MTIIYYIILNSKCSKQSNPSAFFFLMYELSKMHRSNTAKWYIAYRILQ